MRGVCGSSGIYTGSPPDSGLVGTNGEVVSGWRAVPSAEVVREGKKCKRAGIVRGRTVAWCGWCN